MLQHVTITVLLAAVCGAGGEGGVKPPQIGDWPCWAGSNGNCTSEEKGLLREWPKEDPKVLWRIPVAPGANHPSVARGRPLLRPAR